MTAQRLSLLVLMSGFLLAGSGRAATLRAMKLDEMTHRADVIFVGTVLSRVSAWNPQHTRIYTYTTFQVEDELKGHTGGSIVVVTLGGAVGGIGMRVPGMPVFRPREKHLLFVKRGRVTGNHHVVGWAQGDFRVHKDAHSGRETVSRDLGGVNLVGGPAPGNVHGLKELKHAIRRLEGR
jgi:hypothetical protein